MMTSLVLKNACVGTNCRTKMVILLIGWTVFENLKSFEFVPISVITLISNLRNSTYFEKPFGPSIYNCKFYDFQRM